jgi:hypothetical protein
MHFHGAPDACAGEFPVLHAANIHPKKIEPGFTGLSGLPRFFQIQLIL